VAVLPAGATRAQPGRLLTAERLSGLLESLRHDYDFIAVDCPPPSAAAEALMLAGEADLVLISARAGITRVDELRAACRAVDAAGTAAALVVSGVSQATVWSPGVRETRRERQRQRRWLASVQSAHREA
jgi:Mrp family chromosome partitioning ATPase